MSDNDKKSETPKLTGREGMAQSSQMGQTPPAAGSQPTQGNQPTGPQAATPSTPGLPTLEAKTQAEATDRYPGPGPVRGTTSSPASRDVGPVFKELQLTEDEAAEPTAVIRPDQLLAVGHALKAMGFVLLDSVGVDYLDYPAPRTKRFAVLHNVYHPHDHRRLFLRVWLDDGETLPSLYPVWKSANYLEREVYDLMGIVFDGHPDLRKVLTPDDLEGHPLRKDFPLGETPTLFNDGRFLDPAAFRAGLTGQDSGLTGYRGELRRGRGEDRVPPVMPEGGPK